MDRAEVYAYRDRRKKKIGVSPVVDRAYQRNLPGKRDQLQPFYPRHQGNWTEMDRKQLSELAIHDEAAFLGLIEKAKPMKVL